MNAIRQSQRTLWAVLAMLPLVLHANAQDYFLDDFSDGDPYDGVPVVWKNGIVFGGFDGGNRIRSNGDWEWTPEGENMGAYVADQTYGDVSLHTQVRLSGLNSSNSYYVFISARDGYWAGIHPSGEVGIWSGYEWDGTLSNRDAAFLSPPQSTGLDVTENDINLQFDMFGDSLSLTAWPAGDDRPLTPQIMVDDTVSSTGSAGLFHNHSGSGATAIFRWFAAIPMLESPCDLNNNGACTVDDIDALNAVGDLSVGVPVPVASPLYDINGDNMVDIVDRDLWLSDAADENGFATPFLPGDADLDGNVQFSDFLVLAGHFGQQGGWAQGDFDGSGVVQFTDFLILSNNFGRGSQATLAVPEPSNIIMCVMGLVVLATKRQRRTSSEC